MTIDAQTDEVSFKLLNKHMNYTHAFALGIQYKRRHDEDMSPEVNDEALAILNDTWITYDYPAIYYDMRIKEYEEIVR